MLTVPLFRIKVYIITHTIQNASGIAVIFSSEYSISDE